MIHPGYIQIYKRCFSLLISVRALANKDLSSHAKVRSLKPPAPEKS